MSYLYDDCDCVDCKAQREVLNLSISKVFKNLLKTAQKAFEKLYQKGSYSPEDLKTTPEYQKLIRSTSSIFNKAIEDNVVKGKLLNDLKNDVFYFSGLKTHAQLTEASRLLLTADKKIKSFSEFYNDFKKINETYNKNYLKAEYNFAVSSAQMAAKWSTFSDDPDYMLQYRTAGDSKVRSSHNALRDITLPKADPFWDSYCPPNGWYCRCTVVEVLARKYPKSDSEAAMEQGEEATTQIGKDGKNKSAIFRFNPGKQKVVFPSNHPYNKVAGANKVKDQLNKQANSEHIEQIQAVYKKPLDEQYVRAFSHKSGGTVDVHELVNPNGEDYNEVFYAAKAFAKDGKQVRLLPQVRMNDTEARAKIFKGLSVERSNPDLSVNGEYVDVKTPHNYGKITRNANKASSQGATALILGVYLSLDKEAMEIRAEGIFGKNNIDNTGNPNYKPDTIYFLIKGNLTEIKRKKDR